MIRNQDRKKIFFIILIIIAVSGLINRSEFSFGKRAYLNNQADSKISSKVKAVTKTPEISVSQEKVSKAKTGTHCYEKLLKQIAGNCDNKCLSTYLRDKDPELADFVTEGGVFGIVDNEKDAFKGKSRLQRLYNGYFGNINDDLKEKILTELTKEDPQNAYPSMFLAKVLFDNNKPEKANAVLRDAIKKRYRNYITDYSRRLLKLTIHDRRLYASAQLIRNAELSNIAFFEINAQLDLDENLRVPIGKTISQEAIAARGEHPELLWSSIDVTTAHMFIEDADPRELGQIAELAELSHKYYENFPHYNEFCRLEDFMEYWKIDIERIAQLK